MVIRPMTKPTRTLVNAFGIALVAMLLADRFTNRQSLVMSQDPATDKKIIMYWTNWGGLDPTAIPGHLITHVLYAFIDVTANAQCALLNPRTDVANFASFRQLKQAYPHLKIQLSLGGWTLSKHFSDVASTWSGRDTLAQSCVDLMIEHC